MLTPSIGLILLVSAGLAECRSIFDVNHFQGLHIRQNEELNAIFLLDSAVQSGSAADGSNNGVSAPGQSKSQVSENNFINFCKGKTLTNGLQVQEGSCNGIPMGDIPSRQQMVSSIITFPLPGSATIVEKTSFQITVQMINFVAGSFTNAQKTYYSAPQQLSGGNVVGHTHVTVQDMGNNLNPKQPLNAQTFVFFKGINDPGNGNGLLSATVTGGLPAGNYRVCTMASSSNHQLVLMPVAQRGAQDDCTKFTVVPAGNDGGNGGNGGNNGGGNGEEEEDTSSTSLAETSTSTAAESSSSATNSAVETSAVESTLSEIETSTSDALSGVATESVAPETTSILSTTPILTSSPPPFANTSFVAVKTTTRRGRPGNGGRPPKTRTRQLTTTRAAGGNGNGNGNAQPSSTVLSTSQAQITTTSSLVAASTPALSTTTTRKAGNNNNNGARPTNRRPGFGNIKGNRPPTTKIIKIVRKVTIIRTFFVFRSSLGGPPPAISKNGNTNKFIIGNKEFADLPTACQAACGEQFKTCVSFKGPGFEVTKCEAQRKECGVAAGEAVKSGDVKTPAVVTATVTVPPEASVPGSIIAEETISTTVEVPASSIVTDQAAIPTSVVGEVAEPEETGLPASEVPVETVAPVEEEQEATTSPSAALPSPTQAACTPIFQTVTVDAPAVTVTEFATSSSLLSSITSSSSTTSALPSISSAPFSNSTVPLRRRAW